MKSLLSNCTTCKQGDTFSGWTIQGRVFRVPYPRIRTQMCVAKCVCGEVRPVRVLDITSGASKNCGCVRDSMKTNLSHGESKTLLYKVWTGMKKRCGNAKCKAFHNYGGRGIKVCDEWERSFESFRDWANANGFQPGLEIDRADNNGPYAPWNCRFVTGMVNCNNQRKNRLFLAWGEERTVRQWSQDVRCMVTHATLKRRLIDEGWDAERALTIACDTRKVSRRYLA